MVWHWSSMGANNRRYRYCDSRDLGKSGFRQFPSSVAGCSSGNCSKEAILLRRQTQVLIPNTWLAFVTLFLCFVVEYICVLYWHISLLLYFQRAWKQSAWMASWIVMSFVTSSRCWKKHMATLQWSWSTDDPIGYCVKCRPSVKDVPQECFEHIKVN